MKNLKNIGLPLKNIVGIKALSPENSIFYIILKEILNFLLFTHEDIQVVH